MRLMHSVQIKHKDDGSGSPIVEVIVPGEDLFNFLWILKHSDYVEQFKVDEGTATNETFGFGPFEKWVTEFTWGSNE